MPVYGKNGFVHGKHDFNKWNEYSIGHFLIVGIISLLMAKSPLTVKNNPRWLEQAPASAGWNDLSIWSVGLFAFVYRAGVSSGLG
jgi:hypothetical protein